MQALFKILRDRGSISDEEYQQLVVLSDKEEAAVAPVAITPPPAAPAPTLRPRPTTNQGVDDLELRLAESESRLAQIERNMQAFEDDTSSILDHALDGKWYENVKFGGYTQLRMNTQLNSNAAGLHIPNDRTAAARQNFFIRRGRFKMSGDVTEHLYLYMQMDFMGSVGGSFGIQTRDIYADIALDPAKEFRFRVGQSKVPFSWVNLQSSQNRATTERPDGMNTMHEGERDFGVYFMYAPQEVRKRFKSLVKDGLKGSGDYGMLAFGAYNGQGLNRGDRNGEPHVVARLTYPWLFPSGQFFETSVMATAGQFVPTVGPIGTPAATPVVDSNGVADYRVGISAILYPQPFGLETEWNVGQGPELNRATNTITSESLFGGYVQANYRLKTSMGEFFPFARWNYYNGGRKFATNAPGETVNEIDLGLEWSPWKEIELALMYTHTIQRTNTSAFPYPEIENADRIALQVQWNY